MFKLRQHLRLILASASPRRHAFIQELGLPFTTGQSTGAETPPQAGQHPGGYALAMAITKAQGCQTPDKSHCLVLAADTVVSIDGNILGKPRNHDEALAMLRMLNGRGHRVYSGVCLVLGNSQWTFCDDTMVEFAHWPNNILAAYANGGECMDKAGAYAIQGIGAFLIKGIQGSWSNVVGLPMEKLVKLLLENQLIFPA